MSLKLEEEPLELPASSVYDDPEDRSVYVSALERQARLASSTNKSSSRSLNARRSSSLSSISAGKHATRTCLREHIRKYSITGFTGEQARLVRYILVHMCGLASSDLYFSFAVNGTGCIAHVLAIVRTEEAAITVEKLPIEKPKGIPFVVVEIKDDEGSGDKGKGDNKGMKGDGMNKKVMSESGFKRIMRNLSRFVRIMSGLY